VGIAIADVSGKGIPASLLMAICQSNLRHFARNVDSPARVLSELNEVMLGEMRPEMFVTIIYAVIDTKAEQLVFARGGHELPIIVRTGADGQVTSEFIESDGMALGMVPSEIFDTAVSDCTVPFRKGDLLALYTDGVTEAVNSGGIEFGNTRLAEVVRTLRSREPQELVNGILDRISLFAGEAGQTDDFTVVIAKHQ
jgi:sigma-B regulation protein RsbU (phosphoserine phosphatase)